MHARTLAGWALALAAAGALGGPSGAEDADEPADEGLAPVQKDGKRIFRSCAGCHCATDPRISEDNDWLRMNRTTACVKAEDATLEARQALETYLKSDRVIRPLLVTEGTELKIKLPVGAVSIPEVSGSAYLRADGDAVARGAPTKLRLHWQAGAKGRTLPVPAGEYRVVSYALYGRAGKDNAERWMMTASNMNGCIDLTVEEGKTVPLDLRSHFVGDAFAEAKDGKAKLLYSQSDPHGNVATLSVNGDVRLPEYRVFDADGRPVHRGVFENT